MFYVYVLKSLKDGKHYIGHTKDLQRRLEDHNRGKSPSNKYRSPFILAYHEKFPSRAEASQREKQIKAYKGGIAFEKLILQRQGEQPVRTSMLTIYGSDLSGPAIKVRLTASILGIEYTWRLVNLREAEQKQEWFLKINPVGKVPAIDDDGFHLFESNAICKYLCDKHNSPLYPKDVQKRATIEQWIDYVSFHIGANFIPVVFNRLFAPLRGMPVNEKAITDGLEFLKQYFPVVENQLAKHKFIASQEISLADIVLFSLLEPTEKAQIDISSYPCISAWRSELKKQPFYTSCYKEYGEMLKMPAAK